VKTAEVDPRPIGRLQNRDSQDRYAGYVKRLVCYALRVLESGNGWEVTGGEDGAEGELDRTEGDGAESVTVPAKDQPDEGSDPTARRLWVPIPRTTTV